MNKILRNKFNKRNGSLKPENQKTLFRDITDLNKWKDILYSWIRRLTLLKSQNPN